MSTVVLLCLPMRTSQWWRAVDALDHLSLVGPPSTVVLALYTRSAIPFMAHEPTVSQAASVAPSTTDGKSTSSPAQSNLRGH